MSRGSGAKPSNVHANVHGRSAEWPDRRSTVGRVLVGAALLLPVVAVAIGPGTRGWRSWFGERRRLVETVERLEADASPESK
ncbi:MAG: hypothetical protein ACKOTB_08875, partial [Planctomycetia bacterium]